jgi:hypothetical protein
MMGGDAASPLLSGAAGVAGVSWLSVGLKMGAARKPGQPPA